jgi:hypothetical protein
VLNLCRSGLGCRYDQAIRDRLLRGTERANQGLRHTSGYSVVNDLFSVLSGLVTGPPHYQGRSPVTLRIM